MILLDANHGISVERENFERASSEIHGGSIEYGNGVGIISVGPNKLTVSSNSGSVEADLVNLSPS
ncbi:MAG: hypothetical protein ABIY56_08615 [Dokdonella sp.]